MQDLFAKADEVYDLLVDELDSARRAGCQLAENESAYRQALRLAILHERERGTPVTVIGDICRGDPEIADLKRARDCAEAVYKASCEAINVQKLRLRMLNEQINRVWHSGSANN